MVGMLRRCSLCIFMLLLTLQSIAGTLKGKITDKKGAPLSFATVYIKGTTVGTSANAKGEYELPLQPGTYNVVCQIVGFQQAVFSVTISGNETVQHDFSLPDQNLQIKEVVVKATDEDPAYRIIRKAISRRSFHLKQVQSLQTSIYLKGVLRSRSIPNSIFGIKIDDDDKGEMSKSSGLDSGGKGVLYVCEENADYYSQLPDKKRTIIHSVRESGNPNGLGFSSIPPVISFYQNNIGIFSPRGFISPISDNALSYYKYKLLGEYKEDGRVINKIQVMGKRQYEPVFYGTIYIVDGDWAIQGLDMWLTKKANLDMVDSVRITQLFLPVKEDVWVGKSQVLYLTIGMMGLDFTGNFATVYDNQKVNEPIADSIFNDKYLSTYDPAATKKDTTFWTAARPIPLENDELKGYRFQDSVYTKTHDPNYIDSMRKRRNKPSVTGIISSGYSHDGKDYKWNLHTNSLLLAAANFNTVEGWNLTPKVWLDIRLDSNKTLKTKTAFRYGFSNTHFNAITKWDYVVRDRKWTTRQWTIGVQGGKYAFQYNPDNPIPPLYNTISTLFYEHNYMKLYERWDAAIHLDRNYGNGLKWSVKAAYQKRMPLENTTDYSWTKTDNGYTDNEPGNLAAYTWEEHSAVLAKASISYQPGFQYIMYPDHKEPRESRWPTFTLGYEKGIPNVLNSKTDFDKWRFGINGDIGMKLAGTISYNIATGGFLNDKYVSLPDLMHIDGDETIMASPYLQSFQLASYYKFSNTERLYGEAHVEYYMKGLLTNKIPLLRQARWYFVLGNNTFYGNNNLYHTEAFIGIDNLGYKIFRFLRVDYVHSWDSFKQQYNGIRIGIRPGFGFNLRFEDTNGGEF